jgi:hypothetical protein
MKLSMTEQERGDLLIQVTTSAGLTVQLNLPGIYRVTAI